MKPYLTNLLQKFIELRILDNWTRDSTLEMDWKAVSLIPSFYK